MPPPALWWTARAPTATGDWHTAGSRGLPPRPGAGRAQPQGRRGWRLATAGAPGCRVGNPSTGPSVAGRAPAAAIHFWAHRVWLAARTHDGRPLWLPAVVDEAHPATHLAMGGSAHPGRQVCPPQPRRSCSIAHRSPAHGQCTSRLNNRAVPAWLGYVGTRTPPIVPTGSRGQLLRQSQLHATRPAVKPCDSTHPGTQTRPGACAKSTASVACTTTRIKGDRSSRQHYTSQVGKLCDSS